MEDVVTSSDVANVNGPPGAAAPPSIFRPTTEYHTEPRPERIDRSVPGSYQLDPIDGVADRPQSAWIAFFTRPWRVWARLTGEHGVVGLPREAANMTGGQQAWSNWNPRTLRHEPVIPWDEGSEVG